MSATAAHPALLGPTSPGNPADAVLRRALSATSNGIVISDAERPDHPVVYVNASFERITGYAADELIGRNCRILQGSGTDPLATAQMSAALRAGQECRVTVRNYRKNGEPFWNEVLLAPVHDEHGRIVQYVGIQDDVTERRRAEDQVAYLAYHDALTGLVNRNRLQEELAPALQAARARGESVALLYLDLDRFKEVNDRLGHDAGDELLRVAAERLRGVIRGGDVLARQGGDEFLLLLPGLVEEPEEVAQVMARRVTAVLDEPFVLEGGAVARVGASVGLSVFPRDADDASGLLKHADAAMYEAKAEGRSGISLYGSGGARRERRDADLRPPQTVHEILSERAVTSVFQPIVDLRSGAVVAYEALARGPHGSPLERPDRLFGAAREAGRLAELDWICRTTALAISREAGLDAPLSLFVNVEPDAIDAPCPPACAEVWERSADRRQVIVEITERALTARPAELLRSVRAIRDRGWGIALDDVGADTRSLALLPLLAPDVVKLDLRLVHEQPTREIAEIVNAVSSYQERTGARVLAEGIETEAHLDAAVAMGATLGQGWLFGRPAELPASLPWTRTPVPIRPAVPPPPGDSPFEVVRGRVPLRRMTKPLLLAISKHFEHQAMTLGRGAVVVAAFQAADRFTPATHDRYARLASGAAFVAALGVGMDVEPAPGVRGATLPLGDPLLGEWSIAVVGPHFAGALVATDLGDTGPDHERRFDFAVTYDRDLVVAAAGALMRRVVPVDA